jgi:hypothetical protein
MDDVREALRQLIEGNDFTLPAKIVRGLKAEAACRVLPGMPYSIATNVDHCDIWNRAWLASLEGLPKVNPFPDFRKVEPAEWPKVRDEFVKNLMRAQAIALAEPFIHHSRTEETAKKVLLMITIHTAYHIGQIALLKRALRLSAAS